MSRVSRGAIVQEWRQLCQHCFKDKARHSKHLSELYFGAFLNSPHHVCVMWIIDPCRPFSKSCKKMDYKTSTSESSDVLQAILCRCARFACPCCCESTVKITSIAFNLSRRVQALARIKIRKRRMMGFINDNAQRMH
jgi:hypothetical protein